VQNILLQQKKVMRKVNKLFKYILHWKKPDSEETQTISYDIYDNELTRLWRTVIERKLSQDITEPQDYSQHTSFPAKVNKEEIYNRITHNVNIARKMNPNLEWPETLEEITQDVLNYLHERFHEALEDASSNITFSQKYGEDETNQVLKSFKKINHDIHALESAIKTSSLDYKSYSNFHVCNFGLFDKDLREPVTNELREKYFRDVELPIWKPAQLWLGYATVGKNMMHCVYDDDPSVVRDNMLRPQLDIGGETMITYHVGNFFEKTNKNFQNRHEMYVKSLKEFIDKHDLSEFVDYTAPEHLYCKNPILGVISDEYNDWGEDDFYNLVTQFKLSSVEIEDI